MQKILNSICDYENQWGKIYLRKKQQNDSKASAEAEPSDQNRITKVLHFTSAIFVNQPLFFLFYFFFRAMSLSRIYYHVHQSMLKFYIRKVISFFVC